MNPEEGDRPLTDAAAGGQDAERLFALGIEAWWRGELEPAIRRWQEAFAAFQRSGNASGSVLAAFYVCLGYQMSLGNRSAAGGWLRRAERAASGSVGMDAAWVLIAKAHLAIDDGRSGTAEQWALEAQAIAEDAGDVDLRICALAELGAALIEQGRVADGADLLDEAMAAALADDARDRDAVVLVSCRAITAFAHGGELRRVAQWVRAADGFHERNGSPHLYATCRTQLGAAFLAAGEWADAERELQAAVTTAADAEPAIYAEAVATLARLRIGQGRIDDAERLLSACQDHPAVDHAMAQVHLAQGHAAAAATLVRRRLRLIRGTTIESVVLQELLVESEVGMDRIADARRRGRHLLDASADLGSDLASAHARRALGRALHASARGSAAVGHLEESVSRFDGSGAAYEGARTRLLLASAIGEAERESAVADARVALARLDLIGARREADAAVALLRRLGVRARRARAPAAADLTRREAEVLELLADGLTNREIGERLFITRRTVEHHVASILGKTGLARRAEVAAFRHRLELETAQK